MIIMTFAPIEVLIIILLYKHNACTESAQTQNIKRPGEKPTINMEANSSGGHLIMIMMSLLLLE